MVCLYKHRPLELEELLFRVFVVHLKRFVGVSRLDQNQICGAPCPQQCGRKDENARGPHRFADNAMFAGLRCRRKRKLDFCGRSFALAFARSLCTLLFICFLSHRFLFDPKQRNNALKQMSLLGACSLLVGFRVVFCLDSFENRTAALCLTTHTNRVAKAEQERTNCTAAAKRARAFCGAPAFT